MKESLLPLLACPTCGSDLTLTVTQQTDAEIEAGALHCPRCLHTFTIRHGVPRFVELENDPAQRETAENFGAQWLVFDHVEQHHQQQFLDWIAPVTPEFVRGKLVVEGGCGKGRHTRAIAEWGAQAIVGVDLSAAVEAAQRNTRDLPNAHIIQADIYHLPLKQAFDYAFSVGVLHHLPDPRGGFASLCKHLKPGGAISAWVYGRENNGWIVHFINPLREHFTSKLPMRALYWLSYLPSLLLWLVLKLVYLPLSGTPLKRFLFYGEYLSYIARFPFHEIHNIVHDHLTAPVAFYLSRTEFNAWFTEARAEHVELHWHNQNSWRGFGFVKPHAAHSAKMEAGYGA
ncbi:MAG: methyltransferase domain-containing protein [Acidobacteria bacterium]|nr:methyltransferase domain-containing protein [Acidobacteriota bacterium]